MRPFGKVLELMYLWLNGIDALYNYCKDFNTCNGGVGGGDVVNPYPRLFFPTI